MRITLSGAWEDYVNRESHRSGKTARQVVEYLLWDAYQYDKHVPTEAEDEEDREAGRLPK